MADDFSARYGDLLTGTYDCVDRIVLNAYFPLGCRPAGFRCWWRRLHDGSDAQLDDTHLMRMAGRFARRVKAPGSRERGAGDLLQGRAAQAPDRRGVPGRSCRHHGRVPDPGRQVPG
ncbi:MAG: hypothetical protein ACRDOK_23780 [Streptosporangiaceae bacterium]